MKKVIFIVLMVLSMVNFTFAESLIVSEHPGISLVQDDEGDLFLKSCIQHDYGTPCSFPSWEPAEYAPYLDIQLAKIHQIGKKWIDFTIVTYGDIPEAPADIHWIAYAWQFNWTCNPNISDKSGIRVYYHKLQNRWIANWFTVTQCVPRTIVQADLIDDLVIEGDTIKVRVPISDLFRHVDEVEPLPWFALSRRTWWVTSPQYNTRVVDMVPGNVFEPVNAIFELKAK